MHRSFPGRPDQGDRGEASGSVGEVFRLLEGRRVPLLMLENVRNMLVLDGAQAMRFLVDELEALGYRWAYRLVDSRFTGVPQRRQRVIFLASLTSIPARSYSPTTPVNQRASTSGRPYGFYWTEGVRGLGWARDAVPTLKGGSTIGIPSPPAIWNPGGERSRIVTPQIERGGAAPGIPARAGPSPPTRSRIARAPGGSSSATL